MATWDGSSYQEADGSAYYVNSNSNQAANIPTWDYYAPNANNAYVQSATNTYPVENTVTFERSDPNFYNSADRNVIHPITPNVATSTNAYLNNEVTTAANEVSLEFKKSSWSLLLLKV